MLRPKIRQRFLALEAWNPCIGVLDEAHATLSLDMQLRIEVVSEEARCGEVAIVVLPAIQVEVNLRRAKRGVM